jgi:DNA-binding MarR family transcriptional regulator
MEAIYAKPGHLLRRAHQIATAIFAAETTAFDLTTVQYAALVAVDQNPGVDATRLSGLIAFDRSTIGGVIDRLEAKGLLVRSLDRNDRRIKLLYLTRAGKVVLNEIDTAVDRVQQKILEPLPPADREALVHLLARLVNAHNPIAADALDAVSLESVVRRKIKQPAE